eukprot:CAMPEP_0172531206 /NCGR_PEP_ID=MMETSP1067-20121228/4705_1 /TAXON_ID=265564 ORGANISM="Thalassiosira punctigera, Strain Tpunct2005C2" /NCGR_SAMPLE_ID=MMETSP1067 /ASSEMBLY_ACC=CAM_ASM_000444 /LENGTH=71 /DNA_ID=CAMNT_0013315561 /DNA_START=78 /DNA_END=290 /DNA_ORIENTATION=+
MMKIAPIALLLASATFAAAQTACDDTIKDADAACGGDVKEKMAGCFGGCVEKRNTAFIMEGKIPPCPELAD